MQKILVNTTTIFLLLFAPMSAYGQRFTQTTTKAPIASVGKCNTFGTCSQLCGELNGQPCSCIEGFHLNADNKSCDANDPTWKIFYATWSNRVGIIEKNATGEQEARLMGPAGHPIFVSFDARNNTVYWTEASLITKAVYKMSLNGSEAAEIVVNSGLSHPEGIAFDWITGNIYLADYKLSQIIVCRQNPTICTVLVHDRLDLTRDITLHPNKGLMFWTDWGDTPSIMRAGMDGKNPSAIIASGLGWPNGMTVDEGNSRIYWVDAKTEKIESSQLDGSDRQIIYTESKHPFAVDVFGNRIFWSDWQSYDIKSIDKFTGKDLKIIYQNSDRRVNGLTFMHLAKQPKLRSNPCENANCSHICTLTAESSPNQFQCLCPSGMTLDQRNGSSCTVPAPAVSIEEDGPELLLVVQNTLTLVPVNKTGTGNKEHVNVMTLIKSINAVAYSPTNQSVIMSVIREDSKNVIAEYNLASKRYSVLVNNKLQNVTAMDIDPVSENLYWIDSGKKTVEVMSLRTGASTVLLTGENLLDILFIPENGTLYVSKKGSIHRLSIRKQLLNNDTLFLSAPGREPVALFYDRNGHNLLWVCRSCNKIESTSLLIYKHFTSLFTKTVFEQGSPLIQDIVKYKDDIFIVDSSSYLKAISASTGSGQSPRVVKTVSSSPSANKMIVAVNTNTSHLDVMRQGHPCSPINLYRKLCSHICLPTGIANLVDCRCPVDLVLSTDGRSCKDSSSEDYSSSEEFELIVATRKARKSMQTTTEKYSPSHYYNHDKSEIIGNDQTGILSTASTNSEVKNLANVQNNGHHNSSAGIMTVSGVIITILLVIIAALVIRWRKTRSIPLIPKPFYIR